MGTATGRVLAAGLLRSGEPTENGIVDRTNGEEWNEDFIDPASEFYLGAQEFRSNLAAGGMLIPLRVEGQLPNQEGLRPEDQRVPAQHAIGWQETPLQLVELASRVGMVLGPRKALLNGIDFLQDEAGRYHLLGMNPFPGLETLRRWWKIDASNPAMRYTTGFMRLLQTI